MADLYSKFITDHFLNKNKEVIKDEEVFNDSSVPYQQRPEFISEQNQEQMVLEPVVQQPVVSEPSNPYNLQSLKSKENSSISGVLNRLNQMPKEVEVNELDSLVEPSSREDIVGDYQKQLEAAQQDRAQNMNSSALRSGASGMFNAGLIYSGNQHRVPVGGSAHEDLKRMEDLKIKELDEKLKLPTNVSSAEKAQMEIDQMQELQDPNSLTSQSLRSAIKQFLGEGVVPDETLNRMNGVQLKKYAEDIGALKKDKFAMDDKDRNFDLQERQFRDQSSRGWAQINKEGTKEEKRNPGQIQRDKNAANDISEWVDKGNRDMILSDIEKLRGVERQLASGINVTGSVKGRLPFQDFTNTEGSQIEDIIGSVTQKNLRQILGGQFAQKEGEELLRRGYDRTMPEAQNLIRVRALRQAMEAAAEARDQAAIQFEANGGKIDNTTQRFNGSRSQSMSNPSVSNSNEIKATLKDGKRAIFDKNTKQFLRFE